MADIGNTAVISPTDASNGSGTQPSFLGSATPSTLDDAGRALQGAIAREWENRSFPTATGTAPAFVVTYTVAPAALRSGQTYTFTAHAAAVGTDTLNANTLGAKGIKKVVAGSKTATAANDFYTGDKVTCVYDGTDMVWVNRIDTVADASETVKGKVEMATTAEAAALTDTARAVTAAGLAAAMAGKKAIWIDAGAMRPKAVAGADFSDYDSGNVDVTLRCADFDTTTQQYAHFKMAMPEIWNEGTVTFKPYWTNTAGGAAETVVFSLAGLALSNDDALNTAFGTVQTSTDTWIAQNDVHVGPESSAITIAGTPAAGDLVVFEVSRVTGSDTLVGDARLIGLMLYITTNAFNEA